MSTPRAYLLDLDGTLYTDLGPVPGGPELLVTLRRRGIPFRLVTNTTTRSRAGLVQRLSGYGYDIAAEEIVTPIRAAAALCRSRGYDRLACYAPGGALEDLGDLNRPLDGQTPQAVIVGDLGPAWRFELLQEAFSYLLGGADLIALSRDRYYLKQGVLTLDAGPFVAALEFAANCSATIAGKPSTAFYAAALGDMGMAPAEVAMVGDDLWSDVQGAQRAGLEGWLVRTGKFREEMLRDSGITADRVLGSVVEVLG